MEKLFQRDEAAEPRKKFTRVDLREVDRTGMQKLIVAPLGELAGCTVDDVDDAWQFVARRRTPETCGTGIIDSREYLAASVGFRWHSEPLALAPAGGFSVRQAADIEVLWKSANDEYDVTILGALPVGNRLTVGQSSSDASKDHKCPFTCLSEQRAASDSSVAFATKWSAHFLRLGWTCQAESQLVGTGL